MVSNDNPGGCGDADDSPGNAADLHVGMRLKMRRIFLSIDVDEFTSATGITPVQLDNYETGRERVGASLLYQFSRMMEVPISWFFNGLGDEAEMLHGGPRASPESMSKTAYERDGLKLLAFYYNSIPDSEKRGHLIQIARILAEPPIELGDAKH